MGGFKMVTLADVRDYLKSFNLFTGYYVGRIDANKNNVLGVYDLRASGRHKTIGIDTQKYDIKGVSILIHGDTNKTNTEKLAIELYKALESAVDAEIAGRKVNIIDLQQDAPIDVDADDNKIYEYVIEVLFYVERED
jgi:hypothetical protein